MLWKAPVGLIYNIHCLVGTQTDWAAPPSSSLTYLRWSDWWWWDWSWITFILAGVSVCPVLTGPGTRGSFHLVLTLDWSLQSLLVPLSLSLSLSLYLDKVGGADISRLSDWPVVAGYMKPSQSQPQMLCWISWLEHHHTSAHSSLSSAGLSSLLPSCWSPAVSRS